MTSLKRDTRGTKGWYSRSWQYKKPKYKHLVRFLNKNVGRKWSDVYSQIVERFKDVLDCLDWHVDTKVIVEDGEVKDTKGLGIYSWRRDHFYVLNDILHKAPRYTYRREGSREVTRAVVDNQYYAKVNGIWYRIEFDDLPDKKPPNFIDILGIYADSWANDRWKNYFIRAYGAPIYAVKKEQVNSRKVKRIKKFLGENQ